MKAADSGTPAHMYTIEEFNSHLMKCIFQLTHLGISGPSASYQSSDRRDGVKPDGEVVVLLPG